MNDEFFTKAIEEDRYLKAIQLINRFETELRRELEHIGNQFVKENPQLFVDTVEPSWNILVARKTDNSLAYRKKCIYYRSRSGNASRRIQDDYR
jgi:hypothetical protein